MKKILILVALFVFISMGTAFAEITRMNNNVTGTEFLSSTRNTTFYNIVLFAKFINQENKVRYILSFNTTLRGNWLFTDKPFEFQIDDDPTIYTSPIFSKDNNDMTLGFPVGTGITILKDDLVQKINDAQKIEIRVFFEEKPPVTWKVPEKSLVEWKQVINAQK